MTQFKNLQGEREDISLSVKEGIRDIYYKEEGIKLTEEYINTNHPDWSKEKRKKIWIMQGMGYALRHAGEEWQNDKDVVLMAVSNCGAVLEFVSPALKEDRDIVKAALKNDSVALKFVPDHIKKDNDFILEIMRSEVEDYSDEEDEDDKKSATKSSYSELMEFLS
mmetsp:Transcript_23071/g.26325  ORF Transcript_23071/g.26325 Transcript_23071/m.26325 type:complete len:165 (+) Transcript_23071:83-577(+)|eukprot:CAMPEP_0194146348 /NCGR_PEP_ID=MMETSP0152-20130528/20535_1 /TAXON_ID=1049557 /ORGANISM="Thalassiothrix antarctica, Strain L6-D1" /LENGTH=164 /DNA_ID=CAMNT_0038846843 /DNA_START=55 /DNA_END=549 /DNA_ORIENTATION=+